MAAAVNAVELVLAGPESGVDVQAAVGLAVGEEPGLAAQANEKAAADQAPAAEVASVGVRQVGLDEGEAVSGRVGGRVP